MEYDYLNYWDKRYIQYKGSYKSSGNQTLTEQENYVEYCNQLMKINKYFKKNITQLSSILEIGCGFGFWKNVLSEYNYTGVDIVNTGKQDRILDITKDHIKKTYNIILFVNVEQHIYHIGKAFKNIKAMMDENSVLIATAWSVKKPSVVDYEFYHGIDIWKKHFKISNEKIFSEKEKIIFEGRLK